MHFNTGKCNVIRLTHSSKPVTIFYKMNSKIQQEVKLAQYLGITIHKSLEFACYTRETVAKANNRLGFLKMLLPFYTLQKVIKEGLVFNQKQHLNFKLFTEQFRSDGVDFDAILAANVFEVTSKTFQLFQYSFN